MWIALIATCHLFRDKMYLQTEDTSSQWLPCFPSLYAIHADAFKPVYIPYKNLNISLILPPLDFYRNFYHYYHGDCRLLADGMRIFHLECHCYLITVLDRRSRSSYPQYSHRMHLYYLLLDIHQSHTMPTAWRNIIWMFCYSSECCFYPTIITSRWRLQEWFWHHWFTNSITENSSHTPCFQHGTCLFQPSEHYTLQYSNHHTSQYATNHS